MHTTRRFLFAALCAAPATLAQSQLPLPAQANDVDGHHSLSMPFGVPGFRTQILIDADAIAPVGAVLNGIRFRADRGSAPQAAVVVPNVTVTLSHNSLGFGGLQPVFANNVTGATTPVFTGAVTLPAQVESFAGPTGWDIVVQFAQPYTFTSAQGNLLIDIVGNNPASQPAEYWLDALQGGGSSTIYGRAGDDPSFDFLNLVVSTNGFLDPRLLSPGRTIEFSSLQSFTQPPGFLALGFDGLPVPFDLGQIGAPTNAVYMTPVATVPHSWQQSFIGWYSTAAVPIPNDPAFVGLRLYGQSFTFSPAANALGLLSSAAAEVRIGDALEVFPMQQVDADDPAATTGVVVDFGFPNPEWGAVALLLEGIFF